jgi:hypothetical protein
LPFLVLYVPVPCNHISLLYTDDKPALLAIYQSVGRDITDWKTVELDLMKKNEELRRVCEQRDAR